MKNTLCFLGFAAICGLSLSSCVVDPYGYPVAGGVYSSAPVGGYYGRGYSNPGYYGSGYSNANYYGSNYYDNGYGYGYGSPLALTSLSFFGGSGYGYGNSGYGYGRPNYYSGGHHHSSSSYRRPVSSSHAYASQVTRPSTFRGSSIMSRPPSMPSISAPRTLSRPSTRSFSSPAPRMAPSTPSRSFSAPSMPRPSGRVERSSGPVVQASRTLSAPSSSGRFGGMPSDSRRVR